MRELYNKINVIEAKIIHLEESLHELSNYISEMDVNLKEANTEMSRQVNVAINEIDAKIQELSKK